MAKFVFEIIKIGFDGSPLKEVVALSGIIFEPDDEVVVIPSEYNGMPVTHIGYKQDVIPAHEAFRDWHHPSGDCGEYVETEYKTGPCDRIDFPPSVKRLVFPATADEISTVLWYGIPGVDYEMNPDNKRYAIQDNKITYRLLVKKG